MNHKLLLIEDDTHIKKQLLQKLSVLLDTKIEIVTVDNFDSLSDILSHDTYFLALLDYQLVGDVNQESLSMIINNCTPAIVLTEIYDENIREQVISKGVLDYIPKDSLIDYEYLSNLINRAYQNQEIQAIVVDGNDEATRELINLLAKFNIKAKNASSLDELSQYYESSNETKLIIVDQTLSDIDGPDFVKKIRLKYPNDIVSIIGMTSYGHSSNLAVEFLKKGANDYITKPFINEEFNLRIMQSLNVNDLIVSQIKKAQIDHLTQLYNKRGFELLGKDLCQLGEHKNSTMICSIIDIDHFKKINDTYGHPIGDEVLKKVSAEIKNNFRNNDLIARYGGEEFVVLLNDIDHNQAYEKFESLRINIQNLKINTSDTSTLAVTISIGIFISKSYRLDQLIVQADKNLYDAKLSGRNKTVINI